MYRIKEALVYENTHGLKWVYGIVVLGPKGGIYLLDAFCTEQWLKHKLGEKYWSTSIQQYFKIAVIKNEIGVCPVQLDGTNNFITPTKYKGKQEFRRLEGIKKLKQTGLLDKITPLN